jgi:hypothetical protein
MYQTNFLSFITSTFSKALELYNHKKSLKEFSSSFSTTSTTLSVLCILLYVQTINNNIKAKEIHIHTFFVFLNIILQFTTNKNID